MRMLTLTAALMIGTAAIAQTTTPEPPAAPPADAMQPTPPAPEAAPPAEPAPAPMPNPAPPAAPAPTEAAPPAPPMAAPAPTEAAATTATPQANYPRCSKTVTDMCRQSSARESDTKGGRPRRR